MVTRTRLGVLHLLGIGLLGACLVWPKAWADPPTLVARLQRFDGTATFLPAGSSAWAYANINRPLSDGDRLWIGADSRAELVSGPSTMRLGANSDLGILELREAATQLRLTQGSLEVRVRTPMQGRFFEIDTPNLAFDLQSPGDYRVDVDPARDITTVTVRAGDGTAYGARGVRYPSAIRSARGNWCASPDPVTPRSPRGSIRRATPSMTGSRCSTAARMRPSRHAMSASR